MVVGAMVLFAGCHNVTPGVETPLLTAERGEVSVGNVADGRQWPGWRGGAAHGVSPALSLPVKWTRHKNVRWQTSIPGEGHSSPVVWDDQIYLTAVTGPSHRARLALLAIDRRSGELLWKQELGTPVGPSHQKNGHASATVVADGERVYAYFGAKGLFCFSADGRRRWHQPLAEQSHEWGAASSPVLAGGMVIQLCDSQQDSFLASYDKFTGSQIWRTPRQSNGCWTTPVVHQVEQDDATRWQVIVNGSGSTSGSSGMVAGYDLHTGRPLWSIRGTTDIVCPTAIVGEDVIVSSSGGSGPIFAIEPDPSRPTMNMQVRWRLPTGGSYVPTGVIYRQRLYIVDDDGILSCFRLDDGDMIWRGRLGSPVSASLVAGAGHIYVTGESGDVFVVEAADEFKLVSTNSLHESCLATPAIAQGELFIRTRSRLFCISEESGQAKEDTQNSDVIAADAPAGTIRSPSDLPSPESGQDL